jgi:hypothetical protein
VRRSVARFSVCAERAPSFPRSMILSAADLIFRFQLFRSNFPAQDFSFPHK